MRILHVYKNYLPSHGGIETHVRMLAEETARRPGWAVTVLVVGGEPHTVREEIAGVEVVRAGRLGEAASAPLSIALFRELANTPADVVHLHFPYPPGELAYLLFGRKRPMVLTYHSDIVRQRLMGALYRPLLDPLLRRARRILATSPPQVASSRVLARHRARCAVVPLGVDVERFARPAPLAAEVRQRYGSPLTLFVGQFRYYKGLRYLVEGAARLPGRVLLVGSGPEEQRLRRQIAQLGVDDRVAIVGRVGDDLLPAYYQAADVFVLPASERSEAFGIVLLEAMASGKPVVSTELGTGTSYVNVDGETGSVVAPRDVDALTDAIRRLIDDPERRERLGRQAHQRVRAEFTRELMVERVLDVYRMALQT